MLGDPASPLLWGINGDQPDESALPVWCAYTGQSKEAALDWGWLNSLHPNDREKARAVWKQVTKTSHSSTFSCQILQFCQDYRSFKILIIPDFTMNHQIQGWFLSFTEELAHSP